MYTRLDACPVCKHDQFENLMILKDHSISRESFAIVKCKNCAFIFTNPRPGDEVIGSYYESDDYISHQNKSTNLVNFAYKVVRSFTLKKKEKLISRFQGKGNLLDIGCGTGHFLEYCKKQGWKINGVEADENARKIATEQTGEALHSSVHEVPDKPTYDIISLWHVLEHIPDLNEALTKIRKLLKSKGRLLIAVPNHESWDAAHYGDYWAAWDVPRHLWHFDQKSMKDLLKNHQLKIEEVIGMPFDAYYVSMLSERYKTGGNNYLTAFRNGMKSNSWAKKNNNNYSSLIYVIKK